MSKKIRRISSNISSSDVKSIIISGNLREIPGTVGFLDSDHEDEEEYVHLDSNDEEKPKQVENGPPSSFEDYQKANAICHDTYGVALLDILAKLLISDEIDVKDLSVQAVVYKVQSLLCGASGVR